MIFGVRWSPEFSVLAPQNVGPGRQSYPCLGHISWPEAASTWQRLGSHSQRCCGGRPDPAVGQNRQPFGDVHSARGDGQPPATLKRRAEISSHTKKMCSTIAPQGMQGVSFFAETEERKQARLVFSEIAWRHTHQTLCRFAITTEIPKQTGERTVCDRDLLSGSFSRSCLGETEVQHHCTTEVHTVTKPEPQHFAAAKHTMKTDQEAKRDVQAPLYPRPDLQYHGPPLEGLAVHAGASRVAARSSTFSKRLECAHATAGRNDAGHPLCI